MSTGCCPNPLAIALRVMLPESSLVLMNISHLRFDPVGVRFIESRFAGRHKCRPYKDLKRKFLYYQVIKLEVTLLCKMDLGNSLSRADPNDYSCHLDTSSQLGFGVHFLWVSSAPLCMRRFCVFFPFSIEINEFRW